MVRTAVKIRKSLKCLFKEPSFAVRAKLVGVVFGSSRLKIIVLLRQAAAGLTVSQIAAILEAPLSRVSHQLAILRRNGLVRRRHCRREAIYTLDWSRLARSQAAACALLRI